MKLTKIILTSALLDLGLIASSYSANSSDSVLNPNLNVPVPTAVNGGGSTQGPATTFTSVNEYQYEACPAGFTYNGSGQVPNQIRTVTTYYTGGIQVGQSTSPWYDMDADCTTTQYQQIPCPVNYTGVYYQSRSVATSDGDSLQYSDWTTYGNSCVYVPPPPPRGSVQSCVEHDFCLAWDQTGGGDAGTTYVCTSYGDYAFPNNTCTIQLDRKGNEFLGVSVSGCGLSFTGTFSDGNGGSFQLSTTINDNCQSGGGSCFVASTLILMFDGTWKELQSIEVGDVVMGADGLPSIVLGIETPEIGSRRVYRNADDSLRWTEEHKMWSRKAGKQDKQWWWIANPAQQRYEHYFELINYITTGIEGNRTTSMDDLLGVYAGEGYEHAHLEGWKSLDGIAEVSEQYSPSEVVYLFKLDRPTVPAIFNGYVCSSNTIYATDFNWDESNLPQALKNIKAPGGRQ
ncbi:hypothetical protein [Pandoraea communis]|uniref:hypothetical protein n=1 Tax=Pandoraea communis TaxID=2508297 RepID=UPI0025A5E6E4|nr:hypothetical protein [Pandoraea communis]MDM8356186.1 hypothetical protein [Pandoraea communis]